MLAIPATETVNFALLFTWTTNAMSQARIIHSGVQRGGRTGRRPRASKEWNYKNWNAV